MRRMLIGANPLDRRIGGLEKRRMRRSREKKCVREKGSGQSFYLWCLVASAKYIAKEEKRMPRKGELLPGMVLGHGILR